MKTIVYFILAISCVIFIHTATLGDDLIPTAVPTPAKTGVESTIAIGVKALANIATTSSLVFAIGTPGATDPTIAIDSPKDSAFSVKYTFTLPGIYKVYLKDGTEYYLQKVSTNPLTFTITGPDADIITKVEGKPVKDKDSELKLTIAANKLKANDKIFFSTAAVPATTDPNHEVSAAQTGTSYSFNMNFTTNGTYSVFVSNTDGTTKQSAAPFSLSLTSDFLSLGLALLLGLFFI